MRGEEFKARALHEGHRYGEDKMVFLRELAQNARDAGARRIDVSTELMGGEMLVKFADDGAGMDLDHARKYLFTLYASSKELEAKSAGRFGVGFWSVLLFQPSSFEIESRAKKGRGWRISIDGDLADHKIGACNLKAAGTVVTIRKSVWDSGEYERVKLEVEAAIVRYCRYLRRNDKRASALPIYFNGELKSEPFKLDGPCWMIFRNGAVEGAVGLGSDPKVELYARGLLVWRGTVLEELRYSASPLKGNRHPEGLAPVFLLCGNNLNVTLDRRAVVDDGALDTVRRKARQRMRELLWRYLDEVSPRSFFSRISDRFAAFIEDLRLSNYFFAKVVLALAVIMAVVAGAVVLCATQKVTQGSGRTSSDIAAGPNAELPPGVHTDQFVSAVKRAPLGSPLPFLGPTINPVFGQEQLPLEYSPPGQISFRLAAYENLHSGLGIIGSKPLLVSESGDFRCEEGCIDVEVEISAGPGSLIIPVPTAHMVEPGSIALNERSVEKLGLSADGEPIVDLLGEVRGRLKYRAGPYQAVLEKAHRGRLLALPSYMKLPGELRRAVAIASQEAVVSEQVEELRVFVEKRIEYDGSPAAYRAYEGFLKKSPKTGWLDFVLTYGRGDCDVKNTVLVVMLRRLGVPARLAVGVIGKEGKALAGMHAWVEYYDGNWLQADATGFKYGASPMHPYEGNPAARQTTGIDTRARNLSEEGLEISIYDRLGPLIPVAGITSLAALMVSLLLLIMARNPSDLFTVGDDEEKREVAAEMLINAMTNPEAWQKGGGIAARRLLPVIGRRRGMSLREALDRGIEARLWHSCGESDLVNRSVKRNARVLDASDLVWGQLIRRLPGIMDLDETARLDPMTPEQLGGDLEVVGRLIERMNLLLERAGFQRGLILPSPGLDGAIARDVDLTSLIKGKRLKWPLRFVAVNPRSKELEQRSFLMEKNEDLAAFLMLVSLVENSDLLASARERILRIAAMAAIEGVS
jgi:hypothetical protein